MHRMYLGPFQYNRFRILDLLNDYQILGSAYLLGSSSNHLNDVYESETKELEHWKDSPGEISQYDWRDYLGKHE